MDEKAKEYAKRVTKHIKGLNGGMYPNYPFETTRTISWDILEYIIEKSYMKGVKDALENK